MAREWTEEQKKAASDAYAARKKAKTSADAKKRMRISPGEKRDVLTVNDTPDGYVDRIVNDTPGRIDKFKSYGYELVESADIGTSHADGNQADAGVVSRDVGRGVTAYVMRQRKDFYEEDQAKKAAKIDETEDMMRRKKINPNESTDGTYGEVKIG